MDENSFKPAVRYRRVAIRAAAVRQDSCTASSDKGKYILGGQRRRYIGWCAFERTSPLTSPLAVQPRSGDSTPVQPALLKEEIYMNIEY